MAALPIDTLSLIQVRQPPSDAPSEPGLLKHNRWQFCCAFCSVSLHSLSWLLFCWLFVRSLCWACTCDQQIGFATARMA
eukprot:4934749-Amphidinium_carterae.1